jgi:hypothetical protein
MLAKGIGKLRAVKYINHIITLSTLTDTTIAQMTKPNMEQLVRRINASDYKANTKRDHKVILKKYMQWARGFDEDEQEYSDEIRWIKTGQKSRRLLPEELVTPYEVMTLVGAAETPRDRAFKSHRSHQNMN